MRTFLLSSFAVTSVRLPVRVNVCVSAFVCDVVWCTGSPFTLVVTCKDEAELLEAIASLHGQLTATIWGE